MNSSKSLLIKAVTVKCFKEKSLCIPARSLMFLTDVVGESPLETVEDEPAFLPGLDLAPHLHQVALAHLLSEDDLVAGVHAVARRLHVGAQVELLLPDGQVTGHRTGLDTNRGGVKMVYMPADQFHVIDTLFISRYIFTDILN